MLSREHTSPHSLSERRILVVEDEYFLADDIAHALRDAGATIIGPVGDVQEALLLLERVAPIDCAVLDINLRGQMSFVLADRLRELGIPFVFETGYDLSAVPPQYRDVPRWEKPFDPETLVQALPHLATAR